MLATSQSQLDSVLTTVNEARGLPNQHYVSEEVFQQEKQQVLFNNWSGIGFGKDVPEVGDAKPVKQGVELGQHASHLVALRIIRGLAATVPDQIEAIDAEIVR